MEDTRGLIMMKRWVLVGALAILPVAGFAASPSPADCQAYAKRVEMDAGSTAGGVAGGALRGAAFGAIVGDSSKAAGRGAALGGILGGVRNNASQSNAYKNAYDNCMAGRVQF